MTNADLTLIKGKASDSPKALAAHGDSLWYKDAIIYEVHVRSFYDANNDGVGDFQGMTAKLDYLQDLGVTAVWLLPFYPSPLKDDGYDIADYTDIHPSYGILRDFRNFIKEAHARGIRVITELVLNHTSDRHPWFQRARRSPKGSPLRNFYVWSDTPDRYLDARIIFKDFESSNWSWDHLAGAYYWHRFYSHQPDLNFDNPQVRQAMLRVVKFWLGLGVDGLRLDAVPYLFEREGTNCENLPETHQFLKEVRRFVDQHFPNRMLLSEANQWPEDAVAYFGQGDESHMAFHFPLMPRMFMALRMADSFPIREILQETPVIPDAAQWALFLRNHDELTLEMVTDEERDYMYRVYARDPHARINLGIRRRLAPLLNGDRRKIELVNVLLMSLPGTPIIYYGDEINMGDNYFLGDRNGVRTPMQWSADRNAGFSQCNPQQLYLPIIIDPAAHYEAVNVEVQQANQDSLLWWMKRLIALRKRIQAFGRGAIEFVPTDNPKVLAFVRKLEESALVVVNLSRQAQPVTLDLSAFTDSTPFELFGQTSFPPIGDGRYQLSLSPYGYYWFLLQPSNKTSNVASSPKDGRSFTPELVVEAPERLWKKSAWSVMEGILLGYIRGARWYGGKGGIVASSTITDIVTYPLGDMRADLVFLQVEYQEGEPATYALPLILAPWEKIEQVLSQWPNALVANVFTDQGGGDRPRHYALYDATFDSAFHRLLLEVIAGHRHLKGSKREVVPQRTRRFRDLGDTDMSSVPTSLIGAEQSNTSCQYADKAIMKLFRRLEAGVNPDFEISRFLTEKVGFPHSPPLLGALQYRNGSESESYTLAILHSFVPNQGDAWRYSLDQLGHFFGRVLTRPDAASPPVLSKDLLHLSSTDMSRDVQEVVGPYLLAAGLLGQRTAEMHLALASDQEDPDFKPEPFTTLYQRSIYQGMRSLTHSVLNQLQGKLKHLPDGVREQAEKVLNNESRIVERFSSVLNSKFSALRTRVHGDYHLGQVLYTGKDFVIIDFEGEPARPLTERRIKRSPWRDVAGMVRSFHYAASAALKGHAPVLVRTEDLSVLEPWANLWYTAVASTFIRSYLQNIEGTNLFVRERQQLRALFYAYLLEKAVYEIGYELNHRPGWLNIPLLGVMQLVDLD